VAAAAASDGGCAGTGCLPVACPPRLLLMRAACCALPPAHLLTVRGAYMVLERQRALDMGYPSPIYDTAEDTHANYDRCVRVRAAGCSRCRQTGLPEGERLSTVAGLLLAGCLLHSRVGLCSQHHLQQSVAAVSVLHNRHCCTCSLQSPGPMPCHAAGVCATCCDVWRRRAWR
jgi:hypothetical protein